MERAFERETFGGPFCVARHPEGAAGGRSCRWEKKHGIMDREMESRRFTVPLLCDMFKE